MKPDVLPACKRPDESADDWYAKRGTSAAKDAERVCVLECPVRRECGEEADDRGERWGIRAGFHMDKRGRRALKVWLGREVAPEPPSPTVRICECGREFDPALPNAVQCAACVMDLVDLAPLKEHLEKLRVHLNLRQIAERAGVNHGSLRTFVTERGRRFIARRTAELLYAVQLEDAA